MEELLHGAFFIGEELNIIQQQDVDIAVEVLKAGPLVVAN